eukprot:gene67904-93038_t
MGLIPTGEIMTHPWFAATAGPFASQRQSVVNYVAQNLDPESSKTIEGGLRFRGDRFKGVVAVYHVTFDNRLLAASTAAPILGLPPVLSNVGSVETVGVEIAGDLQLTDAFSVYASYSYNDSQYQDDVVSSLGVVEMATAGKTVVNTPKNLFKPAAIVSVERSGEVKILSNEVLSQIAAHAAYGGVVPEIAAR